MASSVMFEHPVHHIWMTNAAIRHLWAATGDLDNFYDRTSRAHMSKALGIRVLAGIIMGIGSANEGRRYHVTSSPIGCAYTHNDSRVSIRKNWSLIF